MKLIRILLAEDHHLVRDGLKALVDLQPDFCFVGEAADGEEACQKVAQCRPDVVLMDISMPGMGGAEATRRIRKAMPDVRVLVLTAHAKMEYVQQLLDAGAAGYVHKQATMPVLLEAIRTVAAGRTFIDPELVAGFVHRKATGQQAALSEREDAVLRLIAEGYSNKEVAARLELSVKSVETYKARAMEKLGLHSRVDLVSYAVRQGWLCEPE